MIAIPKIARRNLANTGPLGAGAIETTFPTGKQRLQLGGDYTN